MWRPRRWSPKFRSTFIIFKGRTYSDLLGLWSAVASLWRDKWGKGIMVSQPVAAPVTAPPAASAQSADPAVLFAGLAFAPVIFEFTMAPF